MIAAFLLAAALWLTALSLTTDAPFLVAGIFYAAATIALACWCAVPGGSR